MTAAAKSVYYFGLYLYLVGITLILVPDFFLTTFKLPVSNEVWIRVVGVLTCCIGYYYHRSGAGNVQSFFKHTVVVRLFVFLSFVSFVLLDYVSPVLILFGVVDVFGAVWTFLALKKDSNE